jgi:hypothetical protein
VKIAIILVLLSAVCAALFFIAPHQQRGPDSMGAFTLFEIFWEGLGDWSDLQTSNALLLAIATMASLLSVFYPVALVAMLRWMPPAAGDAGGPAFVICGVLVALAALVNWIAMMVSQMSFSFGGGSTLAPETAFFWIIPLFQIAAAIASIAVGVSAICASWAVRALASRGEETAAR